MVKYLIFGNGWIGNKFKNYLERAVISDANICDETEVNEALEHYMPECAINAAGKTGRPNIDWCEDHTVETYNSNVNGVIILRDVCYNKKVKLVHISSGCIFEGDNNGKGYSELDRPNYSGSFYSWTKIKAEMSLDYSVLQLRLRMPVDKYPHERNLITKLAKYKNIINVPNSISVIDDFLYAAKRLMENECRGIYNVVNPGIIDHKHIMELYQQIVNPSHTFNIISLEELKKLTKTSRSNCILNTKKLESRGIHLTPIEEAITKCLLGYKEALYSF